MKINNSDQTTSIVTKDDTKSMSTRQRTNKNLLKLTPAQAREFGARGGAVISDKKKYAQQLRGIKDRMKKGQLSDGDEAWLLARCTDSQTSALHITNILDEVMKDSLALDPDTRIKVANAYSQIHKLIHGQKITSENINVNYNIDVNVAIERAHEEIK